MKIKMLLTLCLMAGMADLSSAQIVERDDVSVTYEGLPAVVIAMRCIDTDYFLPENSSKNIIDFGIDSVKIEISSKKVTEVLYTNKSGAITATPFKSRKLNFKVSKPGYKTLEQDWKVTKMSHQLNIFLTREQEK